jgi:hypothetical protein
MTPSEIEPATFRFVAQYLNHYATISGPQCHMYKIFSTRIDFKNCVFKKTSDPISKEDRILKIKGSKLLSFEILYLSL